MAHSSWRTVYWISFAIYATALVLVFFFYRPINQHILEEGKTQMGQILELDFLGLFLYASGLVLFLLGISFGGNTFAWYVSDFGRRKPTDRCRKSAPTIVMIVLGIFLLVVCGIWQAYNPSPYALFPKQITKNVRGFTVILGVVFLVGMLYYSSAILWPEQIQLLYATEPYTIGLYSIAFGLGGTLCGPIAGWLVGRYSRTRVLLVLFTVGTTIASGLMAIVSK